jgi:hypothetical protein
LVSQSIVNAHWSSTELPGASPTWLQLHERGHWEWADPNLRGIMQLGPYSFPVHDAAAPTRREAFSAELIHVARRQLLIASSLSPASQFQPGRLESSLVRALGSCSLKSMAAGWSTTITDPPDYHVRDCSSIAVQAMAIDADWASCPAARKFDACEPSFSTAVRIIVPTESARV